MIGGVQNEQKYTDTVFPNFTRLLWFTTHTEDGRLNRGNIYICTISIIGSFVLHVTELNETGNRFSK